MNLRKTIRFDKRSMHCCKATEAAMQASESNEDHFSFSWVAVFFAALGPGSYDIPC